MINVDYLTLVKKIFMKITFRICTVIAVIMVSACQAPQKPNTTQEQVLTYKATGDTAAITLAKEVMSASGGLKAWQQIPVITWNFFGRRKLLWDKHNNLVRIDFVGRPLKMWVDLKDDTNGQVWMDDHFLTGDSLQDFLKKATSIWINDSYWLNFQFKLLDEGVVLKMGEPDTNMLGESSQTFWMSFENVGDTPNNRYKVYVSDSTQLINQWDFYRDSLSTTPDLATTFENYNEFAGVLLSQKRSGFTLSDIQVFDAFNSVTLKDLSVEAYW